MPSPDPAATPAATPKEEEQPTEQPPPDPKESTSGGTSSQKDSSPRPWRGILDLTLEAAPRMLGRVALTMVLFYSDKQSASLLRGNFSAAAFSLHEQGIPIRFAQLEMPSQSLESHKLARTLGITLLPDIKIFRDGMHYKFRSSAGEQELLDVMRWNAGAHARTRALAAAAANIQPPPPKEVDGTADLEQMFARGHETHAFLVEFKTRWCSRCLAKRDGYPDVATLPIGTKDLPVTRAIVDMDNPNNYDLIDKYEVISFPVTKVFYRGKLIEADFDQQVEYGNVWRNKKVCDEEESWPPKGKEELLGKVDGGKERDGEEPQQQLEVEGKDEM